MNVPQRASAGGAQRWVMTDSPWFWLMLFACAGLIGLQITDSKYRARQSQLERQYQGREYARQRGSDAAPAVEFSTEERMIITLRPIRAVTLALFCLATATVWVKYRNARLQAARERADAMDL